MYHRPVLALLLGSALALPALAPVPASEIILAQSSADEDSNPLAPFLKRSTPAPDAAPAEEEAVQEETPQEEAETPAITGPETAEPETTEPALPRKGFPKADQAEPETAEPETPPAPEVVIETVREPTSRQWISPNAMYEVVRPFVDRVEVDPTGGDTTLEGMIDGTAFQVYFYECDGGDMASVALPDSECLGYEWRSYFFDYRAGPTDVNNWNANYHYGKLFIDGDGDLAVQLNVVVEGGIEDENILTTLAWFKAILDGVHDYYR